MESEVLSRLKCYHCGEDCKENLIEHEDKPFCCNGCLSVYELLADNNLCTYYQLDHQPGIKIKETTLNRFDYLDHEDIRHKLITFSDQSIAKITWYIPAIHCSSCLWLLENLNKLNKGVLQSRVYFERKEVTTTLDQSMVKLSEVASLLTELGYEPKIEIKDSEPQKRAISYERRLVIQIGVAGFCFGNIMLFNFPDYLGMDRASDPGLAIVFGYLSMAFALPVFLYSCQDYFRSTYQSLKHGLIKLEVPITLGIVTLFGRSMYEVISQTGPGYFDSFTGLIFFLLCGKWYQNKSYKALTFQRDYHSYFPLAVSKWTGEKEEILPIDQLQTGDCIRMRSQEIIPCDSELLSDKATLDYSFVTGESHLIYKSKGEQVFAGARVKGGSVDLKVTRAVSSGYLADLWAQESFAKEKDSTLSGFLVRFSTIFTSIVLILALGTFIFWWFYEPSQAWNTVVSVLLVACPCALALSTPFTYGYVMRIMGKREVYLRKSDVVESLAGIDTIVFDKTGTLTEPDTFTLEYKGATLTEEERMVLSSLANHSTHPLSQCLSRFYAHYPSVSMEDVQELKGKGLMGRALNKEFKLGSAIFTGAPEVQQVQSSQVHVQISGVYKGFFSVGHKLKPGIDQMLEALRKNYSLELLSGDRYTDVQGMTEYFEEGKISFGRTPEEKLDHIKALKAQGKKVMMVGDGLNDAGALRESAIGVAVVHHFHSFSPACDIIMPSQQLKKLPSHLRAARLAFKIVWNTIFISALYNVLVITMAMLGKFNPLAAAIIMPVSSIGVILYATLLVHYLMVRQSWYKHDKSHVETPR